jgi:hypothetical protein
MNTWLKTSIFFFLVLGIQHIVDAQNADPLKQKSPIGYVTRDSDVYVINGAISDQMLKGIDPHAILFVDTLKRDSTSTFDGLSRHNIIIAVTKDFAIRQYKAKFSSFSEKYSNYLKSHNDGDHEIDYVAKGAQISSKDCAGIKKLYELSQKRIDFFKFFDNPIPCEGTDCTKYIVVITTKSNH